MLETMPLHSPEALAWEILAFEQRQLPRSRWSSPRRDDSEGLPHVGLLPLNRSVPFAEVPEVLATLEGPVLLASLSVQGAVGVWRGADLSPDIAPGFAAQFENQRQALRGEIEEHGLQGASRVALCCDGRRYLFTCDTLSACLDRFAIMIGWRLESDDECDARLVLAPSSGKRSDSIEPCPS